MKCETLHSDRLQSPDAEVCAREPEPPRSADFQSAVSQVSNLQDAGESERAGIAHGLPIGNRRYSRLETCATTEPLPT